MRITANDSSEEIMLVAADKWGKYYQLEKTIEECAELIVAIKHHNLGKVDKYQMIDEAVDTCIVAYQLGLIWDIDYFNERMHFKLKRLKERLGE